jgi:hypothetical protein
MKKSEILSLSVALASSIAAMMPPSAHAASVECGSVSAATDVATCDVSGGYLQEQLSFAGSKGVKTNYDNDATYFAACSSHVSGNNSFGMTTESTAMTIRTATGKSANQASGCAA